MATLSSSRPQRKPEYRLQHCLVKLFHDGEEIPGKVLSKRELTTLHTDPNIFLIKEFLTTAELEYINEFMTLNIDKFQQSHTECKVEEEVISIDRTSTSIHFPKGFSKEVRAIEQRAAEVAGTGAQCVEQLQLVRYVNGQQFTLHHDAGTLFCEEEDGKIELIPPRRLITIFVYLNSLSAQIGSTVFPLLDLTVQPSARDALLFCNILPNGDPDPRVVHSASVVPAPFEKYGMNIWVDDRDVITAEDLSSMTFRKVSKKRQRSEETSHEGNKQKESCKKTLLERAAENNKS